MKTASVAQFALAAALAFLAAAILYVTFELAEIRKAAPALMNQLRETAQAVEPVAAEVGQIRASVPTILAESEAIRATVPDILAEIAGARASAKEIAVEIAAVRKLAPSILAETALIREAVPNALQDVERSRQTLQDAVNEVEAIHRDLPSILASLDAAAEALSRAAGEVEKTRPLVPEILDEMEQMQARIDPALDRLDGIVTNARSAGKEASEGAVSGLVTGILKAPFSIFGGFGGSGNGSSELTGGILTASDFELARAAFQRLDLDRPGDMETWANPDTDLSGRLIVVDPARGSGSTCKGLESTILQGNQEQQRKRFTICPKEGGGWVLATP